MADHLQDELDAYLAGMDPDDPAGSYYTDEPPLPADSTEANRMLRRLAYHQRQLSEIRARVQAERERLDSFEQDRCAGEQRQIDFLSRSLEFWTREHCAERGVKSVTLPYGVLATREAASSVVVLDEDKAVAYVEEERPMWVRHTAAIDKRSVAAAVFPGEWRQPEEGWPALKRGFAYREALDICGWSSVGFLVVPLLRTVPCLMLAWPTQRSFSAKPNKEMP